jgi:hypothetical protein
MSNIGKVPSSMVDIFLDGLGLGWHNRIKLQPRPQLNNSNIILICLN